jgi:glutamine amidotransferase
MFAYVGSSTEELMRLYEALKNSAQRDTRRNNTKHSHGWGYVIYDQDSIYYYKSKNAIFEENFSIPKNIEGRNFYAIFHARQASNIKTVSSRFSHPFIESNEEEFIYLAHNGYVNEEKLKSRLNYNGLTIDSELVTKFLAKYGLNNETIEELKELTVTGLNLLILKIDKTSGEAELYYLNYYKRDKEYYEMYYWEGLRGKAIISSTLLDYGIKGELVEFGKLLKIV